MTTEQARRAIDAGFVGRSWVTYPPDATLEEMTSGRRAAEAKAAEFVEFRDLPPVGLTFSRTTEAHAEATGTGVHVEISGGPALVDWRGDFVLSIEVPDDVALVYEVKEDDPYGWPFREFWLTPDQANAYRHTLVVHDSDTGEEVRPDLVGK